VEGISGSFDAEMGNSKSKVLSVEFRSKQLFLACVGIAILAWSVPTNLACRHNVGREAADSPLLDTIGRKTLSTCYRPVFAQRQPS